MKPWQKEHANCALNVAAVVLRGGKIGSIKRPYDTQHHFNLKKSSSRASDVLVGSFFFYFPYHNPLSYPLLFELKSGWHEHFFSLTKKTLILLHINLF